MITVRRSIFEPKCAGRSEYETLNRLQSSSSVYVSEYSLIRLRWLRCIPRSGKSQDRTPPLVASSPPLVNLTNIILAWVSRRSGEISLTLLLRSFKRELPNPASLTCDNPDSVCGSEPSGRGTRSITFPFCSLVADIPTGALPA